MTIKLYDLAAADPDIRFSPNCWRVRMALAHKGLDVETIPWRFTEKAEIEATNQGTVPVIVDGDRWVHDSWTIAEYLDETYPDKPLFACAQSKAHTRLIRYWLDRQIHRRVARQVVFPIYGMIADKDKVYFRELREKNFGMTLEEFNAGAPDALPDLRQALEPLRATVGDQPFVSGEAPAMADYLAFGAIQWARVSAPHDILADGDPVADWRERMLDLFDGLGRAMPARGA